MTPSVYVDKYYQIIKERYEFDFNGDKIYLGYPNIGLEESILKYKNDNDDALNKIFPYMFYNKTINSKEEYDEKMSELKNISDIDKFLFINSAIDEIKLGIKYISIVCQSCNKLTNTDVITPSDNMILSAFVNPKNEYVLSNHNIEIKYNKENNSNNEIFNTYIKNNKK